MDTRSRTYNSISNSIYGILCSTVTVFLNFFVRIVLVRELGEEINGLHNLFQSITSVMLLMEMGISSAMIIHLYAPIKNHDIEEIKGIMGFYKKVYLYLAIAFTTVSILVSIFLINKLVTSSLPLNTVRIYFLLFALSFAFNYLTQYKRSILFAEQKNRISIGITAICEVLFRSLQIVFLLVWHQYITFLIITIIEKLASNFVAIHYINKYHPYLNDGMLQELPFQKKLAIFNTVKPLMVFQVANTVQNASKGILISILLGNVAIVGYYGNYQLVISMVEMIYAQFGGAFTTSFGNLSVDGTSEHKRRIYFKSAFIMNWIAAIMCAGFIACIQDFIYLVFGDHFVLEFMSVLILTVNMMVYLLNIPVISIQNAMGLHNLDVKWMILQAITAIVLGYVGGILLGMTGIFVGLLIPLVVFTLIRKGIVVNKRALDMEAKSYLLFICKEIIKITLSVVFTIWLCEFTKMQPSVLCIILKGMIALVVGIFTPVLFSFKSEEFLETVGLIKKVLKIK